MTEILVTPLGSDLFRVEIREGQSNSVHDVTVTPGDLATFAQGHGPQKLLEESFRFLLEREPKQAILPRFDLPVIARYFPDYPTEIRRRLGPFLASK
ncbi:MAG: hypothetical protein RI637_10135 [Acidimicrobiia bacterium]|nr:hypothetical protein [Acidimicrobiia bacterium]